MHVTIAVVAQLYVHGRIFVLATVHARSLSSTEWKNGDIQYSPDNLAFANSVLPGNFDHCSVHTPLTVYIKLPL